MRTSLLSLVVLVVLVGCGGAAGGGDAGDDDDDGGAAGHDAGRDPDGGAGIDGAAARCKRGIAANDAPGTAFGDVLAWSYNWAIDPADDADPRIEHAPMTWGGADVDRDIPAGSAYLLGFNEPNFQVQSDLTPEEAAALWPQVEAQAAATGAEIVSPALNFCGPAGSCNGTNPYDYLRDFFAACVGCRVDHVAVHWYNCDLPSLIDYLEPGGALEGFEQFGKPIWLTEFSCDGGASVAQQEAYMRDAIPYLEANAHVFRYAWFSASPIPNAELLNDDGSPTALGEVYLELPGCE